MIDAEQLRLAIEHLTGDGFIGYPTETVWGLGACADRPDAVRRLIEWKGRGPDAPMSVLVSSVDAAVGLGCSMDGAARRLADAFWPGPLTLVVDCQQEFAEGVAGEGGALGLRCSPHPLAQTLVCAVAEAGLGPLTSTSMNRSGSPPAENRPTAEALVAERRDDSLARDQPLLVGDVSVDADGQTPSSVVDCTQIVPTVLRMGAIDRERLEGIWSESTEGQCRETHR